MRWWAKRAATRRELERLLARLFPQPDVTERIAPLGDGGATCVGTGRDAFPRPARAAVGVALRGSGTGASELTKIPRKCRCLRLSSGTGRCRRGRSLRAARKAWPSP